MFLEYKNFYKRSKNTTDMKDHCHGHHGHKHFFIHLAFQAVTLLAAIATLHEVEKIRKGVKSIERR